MSAALLASLMATIAAPAAMAAITGTSAGNVAPGTTSAGTASYLFTESSATALTALAPGCMQVRITTAGVTWTGTPVVSAPGSLGATATIAADVLRVSITASDNTNVETISITGLKVAVPAGTPAGAVAVLLEACPTGTFIGPAFTGGTVTATGKLTTAVGVGSSGFTIALDTGSCAFNNAAGATVANPLVIAGANPETITSATIGALIGGQQVVSAVSPVTAVNHLANDPITQTGVPGCVTVPSPATVVLALDYTSAGNTSVFPGENNQLAGNLTLTEPAAGFLTASTTVTLKINTAGVLFSSPPTATVTAGNLLLTSGTASNEVQTVTLAGAGAGDTFTLTFGAFTTAAIPITADGPAVDTALSTGLGSIPAADVTATGPVGGPYTITFTGANAATNVAQLVATATDAAPLGPFTATVATTVQGGSTLGVALSADRTAITLTVGTVSTVASTIVISNIRYDVASTVPSGTLVTVEVTASGGKLVNPTTRTNAQVGRIFNASSPAPNVNIGQNGQTAGLITIVEVTAGAFTDGTGSNNVFEICHDGTYSFTSPGPSAFVSGGVAAGNLILREGSGASTDNIVPGTADPANPGCFYWTVWTKSTTASTITIGSSATAGPLVNVNNNVPAGPLNATLSSGTLGALVTQVSLAIANRVFPGQVSVTAVSQPIIRPGATHALAGDILIQENGNGQLKLGTTICVDVVPNAQSNVIQDVYFSSLNTADLPLATAANGVVIGAVSFSTAFCNPIVTIPTGTLFHSFRFVITQQSTTGTGKVTISNIHYNVVADAALGPVQVNVYGFNVGGASIDFQRIISNAVIGVPAPGTAATRLGVTQVGAFTISTKIAKRTKYVTYRLDFGVAAAGRAVQIWGATKTGNDWSAFTVVTTRTANASGVVYYYIRQNAATWRSYRGFWVTGGAFTPARQARWIP